MRSDDFVPARGAGAKNHARRGSIPRRALVYSARVSKPPALAALAALVALVAVACESAPPVKAASGERIDGVSFEERFAVSTDTNEISFHGEGLRKAVELMDRAGVMSMSGNYAATGVLDRSKLTLTVRPIGGQPRVLVVKNCAEPHLCAFFTEATKSGVVEKMPVVCRDAPPCAKK